MSSPNINALWFAYCAARDKAEASKSIEDGIAAGRAWGAFIRAFEGNKSHTPALHVISGASA